MTAKIKQWFASHNITTHSVAAAILFLGGLYTQDPQFKHFADSIVALLPAQVKAIIPILPLIYMWYRRAALNKLLNGNNGDQNATQNKT